MRLRDKLGGRRRAGTLRTGGSAELDHLAQWAEARRGVEGFVEPQTTTTATTLVLVASDGEWTRRRVPSPKEAFAFGSKAGIPVYDVAAVGYPSRMREWTSRRKAAGEHGPPP